MGFDLSNQSKYAILAVAYLARQKKDRLVPIQEIGEHVDAPRPFLAKVLAALSRNGLVASRRGPRGGVRLARRPADLPLGELVQLFEHRCNSDQCFLGLSACNGANPCPLHKTWKSVREELDLALGDRTIADLVSLRGR